MSEQLPESRDSDTQDDSHDIYSLGDFQGMYDFEDFNVDHADRFTDALGIPEPGQLMLPGTEDYQPRGDGIPAPDFVAGLTALFPRAYSHDMWIRVDSRNKFCDWPERTFTLAHDNPDYFGDNLHVIGAVFLTLVAGRHVFASAEVYFDAPEFTGSVPEIPLTPQEKVNLDDPVGAFQWLVERIADEGVLTLARDSQAWS